MATEDASLQTLGKDLATITRNFKALKLRQKDMKVVVYWSK